MSGQILDATLVAAPKQRNTNAEKANLREERIPEDWQDKPARLSHKDRQVRWILKVTKAKRQDDGTMFSIKPPKLKNYKPNTSINVLLRPTSNLTI